MIYALGGVSGSGKTWLRSYHPALQGLRCIDIAQFYRAAEARGERLDWWRAKELFFGAVRRALHQGTDSIVLEAFFRPEGPQRAELDALAHEFNEEVTYVWCAAPRGLCKARVEQADDDTPERRQVRLRFIRQAAAACFWPVAGESVEEALGSRVECCRRCRLIAEMAACPACSGPSDVCVKCAYFPPFAGMRISQNDYMNQLEEHRHANRCEECEAVDCEAGYGLHESFGRMGFQD